MFSQQIATRELMHNDPVRQYVGSYDFSDSAFSITEGESQCIEFSQFPNSQELFSNYQLPGKEAVPATSHFGGQSLSSSCENNREICLDVPKLRVMSKEKDERILLENISNSTKEYVTEFSNLHKSIQNLVGIKDEISSMKKTIALQEKLVEKINTDISLEFKNCKQMLSSLLEETKKQRKGATTLCSEILTLQKCMEEERNNKNEQNKPVITLQKMVSSYKTFSKRQYLEMKQQQNELNRILLSLREIVSELSIQLTKREKTDHLRYDINSLGTFGDSDTKDELFLRKEKYNKSPFSTKLLDCSTSGNAVVELMQPAKKSYEISNMRKNAQSAILSPRVRKSRLQNKGNDFQMKKYSLKTASHRNNVYSNKPIISGEEANPLVHNVIHKQRFRRASRKLINNVNLQQPSLITSNTCSNNTRKAINDSLGQNCFYKRVLPSESFYSPKIGRNENSANLLCEEYNCSNNNVSHATMLSISKYISKVDGNFSNDSSPCLSISDLTNAISMNVNKHRRPSKYK